jgi:hypothetical protein
MGGTILKDQLDRQQAVHEAVLDAAKDQRIGETHSHAAEYYSTSVTGDIIEDSYRGAKFEGSGWPPNSTIKIHVKNDATIALTFTGERDLENATSDQNGNFIRHVFFNDYVSAPATTYDIPLFLFTCGDIVRAFQFRR